MTDDEFKGKLFDIVASLAPAPPKDETKRQKKERHQRVLDERRRVMAMSLQGYLDTLQLMFKYWVFDLEATQRENAYMRKILEETTGND